MQVKYTRWSLTPKDRTEVTVNPKRVDCVEFYMDAIPATGDREAYPACSKIIMAGKQEYLVQGTVDEVKQQLNNAEVELVEVELPGTFPWKEKK